MKYQGGAIIFLLSASAFAWQGPLYDRITVDFPYPVRVLDKTLQPGSYTIQEDRSATKNNVLHIFDGRGMKLETTVQTIPTLNKKTPSDTSVILDRYGDNYYLDKIWVQGKDYGYQFREPASLKSLQRERRESATIPARYLRGEQADARQTTAPSDPSTHRLEREVRHELVMLPYYGVFDNLAFNVSGNTVTLMGEVTRPTLKSEAENVVKGIEGVDRVVNNIEVLPLSPNDDQLRMAVYRSVYSDPALNRYALQAVPPIHIIVKNGNVKLTGVVANENDINIAYIRANSVPGVLSVKNELRVEG